jgi:biotin transport system ATP-binding protein
VIRVQKLGFSYPGQEPALDEVSFGLEPGQTLGLVGSNGSGKSTLLSLLAGLLSPTRGEIALAGFKSPGSEQDIRRQTSLVMQDADLMIIGATVAEDLGLAESANLGGLSPAMQARAREYGLGDLLQRAVHELSWGQKKRLCLASALQKKPQVILLDEPFAGLDYPGIRQMRSAIAANRQQGLTQIIAAHGLEPLADLVDKWAVLNGGRLVLWGEAEAVFDHLSQYEVRPPEAWSAGLGIQPWD